jgi:short-subunit dehydrogenase
MSNKNIVIIGASSGIGRELAKIFSEHGFTVGITARRLELLSQTAKELPGASFVKRMDISNTNEAINILEQLIEEMGGVQTIVINAGIGFVNPDLEWEKEKSTIDVNVTGFTAMATTAMNYFTKQGFGHLVGISSISAIRGSSHAPAYSASKAFISHYLEAMRFKVFKMNIPVTVTDIQPGFVDTAMAKGDKLFWVAPARTAALQIFNCIQKNKTHAYITKRWRLIAWLLKLIPARLLAKYY